ncbi:hypothetical protein CROQUDRAFT_653815 [Cronartium quercuum f. sp. fusiforme G11]|uniref:RING-type E3 ubiquitin transferase n=1 Tax=Cronartium quercuum f. sp. fusiforme G11 TaxID=708437 RepID=A0A9P6TF07_9BASI|nr:hypothetical protein CROQUDRAFT_653815 [Cronartium quercuum f. sp. fusiforme G11]
MEPTTTSGRPQPSSFPFLLITALLFYFFSKSPSAPHNHARENLIRALDRRQHEIIGLKDWLNSSTTNPIQTNTTPNSTDAPITQDVCVLPNQTFGTKDLTEGRQFVSRWIDDVQARVDRRTTHLFWRNLTGHIKADWKCRRESLDWYPNELKDRLLETNGTNLAANSSVFNSSFVNQRGRFPWIDSTINRTDAVQSSNPSTRGLKVGYNLRESTLELVRSNASLLRGSMYFSAPDSKDVSLNVEGVHFQDNGTLYLRAWPESMYLDTRIHLASALDAHDFRIPSINNSESIAPVPSLEQMRIGQVILADLEDRARKVEQMLLKGDIPHDNDDELNSSDNDNSANCSFIIYATLTPVSASHIQTSKSLHEYEDSLTNPTGASIPTPSPQHPMLQALMISPNCGLILEMKESPVMLAPMFWAKGRMYGWIAGLITGAQCWLLVWQMDSRQSPSSLSRMSYLSLVTQIVMDAWTFSSHLTLSVVTNNASSQLLMIPAFFACLSAILFGMRYGTLIRMHAPSPPTPRPTQPITQSSVSISATDERTPSLENQPLLDSVPTTHRRSAFPRVFGFMLALIPSRPFFVVGTISICIICIPIVLYTWQPLILCILYSYWIPQIIHNVRNGTSRRGLRKRYVLGSTVCRLYLPLYIWGCPHNAFSVDPNPWIWILAVYSIFQAVLLLLQDYFGARFFLIGKFFSYGQTWDYHPVQLPAIADLEVAQKMPECVICFESINALPNEDRSERGMFDRWSYMVPPCHHIAHTRCLEAWLAIKSECPVCRRPLPPI